MGHSTRQFFGKLGTTLFGVVLACVVIGFLGAFHWAFDVFSNFRLQYIVALCCTAIILWLTKNHRVFYLNLLLLIVLALSIAKFYIPNNSKEEGNLKIASINLLSSNKEALKVKSWIHTEKPDVILFMEYNGEWHSQLFNLVVQYPYRKKEIRQGHFGIAIYSKLQLNQARIVKSEEVNLPSIKADIEVDGKIMTIIGSHPPPPMSFS